LSLIGKRRKYIIEKSRDYAITAHGEQKYGDKPYIHQLEAVVKILEPYGSEAKLIGYLHDVAEDTHSTKGTAPAPPAINAFKSVTQQIEQPASWFFFRCFCLRPIR